jgi:hypothetical protein
VTDAERLKRCLLAIPETGARIAWLRSELGAAAPAVTAPVLDALVARSEAGDAGAREALAALALLVVADPDVAAVEALREVAEQQRLLHLERVLRRAPVPPFAEGEAPRVPDYGAGRELSLGERRSLARKPSRAAFDKLLLDPHPLVIRQLLGNPRLTEDDVLRLVTRRPAHVGALREVVRTPRWLERERIRLGLLLNPGTPTEMCVPLLGLCKRSQLREVLEAADVPLILRATARELLERRPPLEEPDLEDVVLQ